MPFPNDRRSEPRLPVALEVNFESEHNFYTGLTQDLSGCGLFVATQTPRSVGEQVRVRFTLPTFHEVIEAVTEVRWVRPAAFGDGGGAVGMGLRFLQISPHAKEAIVAFLKKREAIFFDAD